MVFRDDVRIEDRSRELPVVLAIAPPEAQGVLGENARAPIAVATGDGTLLALDGREAMPEAERIARLLPRHGHEIAEAFNPFEVGPLRASSTVTTLRRLQPSAHGAGADGAFALRGRPAYVNRPRVAPGADANGSGEIRATGG